MSLHLVRTLLRGLAKPSDLADALNELGIEKNETFIIAHPEAIGRRKAKAGRCVFCGERINVNRDYRCETGWAKARSEGGTNALALREVHPDEWACTTCIDKLKRGIAIEQATLT